MTTELRDRSGELWPAECQGPGRTLLEWDKKEGIKKDGDHLEKRGAPGREGWVETKSARVVEEAR